MTETTRSSSSESAAATCPVGADIGAELFEPGSQERWFESYRVLHEEAPISRIPGAGWLPGTDAFVISKFDDIAAITRDPRFLDFAPEDRDIIRAGSSQVESEVFREEGLSRTEISRLFKGHQKSERITRALDQLQKLSRVTKEKVKSDGRDAEVWKCT